MELNCNTNLASVGGGCCGRCSSLENRKQYIRLLNSIYAPERIGV